VGLVSRKRPDGLTPASSGTALFRAFSAYSGQPPDDVLFEQNFKAILDDLQQTHKLPLLEEDVPNIRYVYEYFGRYGPDLTYWMSGGFGGRGGFRNSPTYADLMLSTDAAGPPPSHLPGGGNMVVLKKLETGNLILPLAGHFPGPEADKILRARVQQAPS